MPGEQSSKQDLNNRSRRFRETARELGCDEDEQAFKDNLREIARQKPKDDGTAPEPKRTDRKRRTG